MLCEWLQIIWLINLYLFSTSAKVLGKSFMAKNLGLFIRSVESSFI